jgi:hypothetical protein
MVDVEKVRSEAAIRFAAEFVVQFTAVLQEKGPELETIYMNAYDSLADAEEGQTGQAIRGKDPTSLKKLRPLFLKQIRDELSSNIIVDEAGVSIRLMEENLLGYGDEQGREGPPKSVDVLHFYITGNISEFGFITPEQYKARGRRSSKPLGRVGAGFLIPRKRYEQERWQEVTGLTFSDVRHPISGQSPYKGFRVATDKACKKIAEELIPEAVERTKAALDPIVIGS